MAKGRPPIQDEFSDAASKQRRYQLRRIAKGLCEKCGAPVEVKGQSRCATHRKAMNAYNRAHSTARQEV